MLRLQNDRIETVGEIAVPEGIKKARSENIQKQNFRSRALIHSAFALT
jgi:hypothetical protein